MRDSKYHQMVDVYPYLKFPQKYKGTRPITTRSSWETAFIFKYLDINQNIIEWTSESEIVPYLSPLDGKRHRYFVDFSLKAKKPDGSIKEIWVEIKPYNQSIPPKIPKRKTKNYIDAVQTYMINEAKWQTTQKLCENYRKQGKDIDFAIITEIDCPWFLK